MNDVDWIETDSPGDVGLVEPKDFVWNGPFDFEDGHTLNRISIRYETYGHLNRNKDNGILICHALSGDHHCAGIHSIQDRKTGWWNNLIGPGKPVDTNQYFVVCTNCIGGCQGTTGPSSVDPSTGKPYGLNFPEVTVGDMVKAQKLLLEKGLGVDRLYGVIGGSMGGMQVLQWAIDYPGYIKKYLPMATTARQSAQAIAFNEVGRCAIMQDPDWANGNYARENRAPNVGLAVARMMAHITYLSDQGLEEKFGRSRRNHKGSENPFEVEFEVESYLRYQGQSFTNRFDANTYLYFTKALDRFDLYGEDKTLDSTLDVVEGEFLVIGFSSDWLFPPKQNREIAHALIRCGKRATYAELNMSLGHDSFLVHAPELYRLVKNFLAN